MKCPEGHECKPFTMPLGGKGWECLTCDDEWSLREMQTHKARRAKRIPEAPFTYKAPKIDPTRIRKRSAAAKEVLG